MSKSWFDKYIYVRGSVRARQLIGLSWYGVISWLRTGTWWAMSKAQNSHNGEMSRDKRSVVPRGDLSCSQDDAKNRTGHYTISGFRTIS